MSNTRAQTLSQTREAYTGKSQEKHELSNGSAVKKALAAFPEDHVKCPVPTKQLQFQGISHRQKTRMWYTYT